MLDTQILPSPHSPIFVVGYMHSGTTLLQNILSAHPAIFAGQGESRFFDYLPVIKRKFPNLHNDQTLRNYVIYLAQVIRAGYGKVNYESAPDGTTFAEYGFTQADIETLLVQAAQSRNYIAIFGLIFDYFAKVQAKDRWLEKTPDHLFHVETILRHLPDARFVELVRDPRDILASKHARQAEEWVQRNRARESAARLRAGYDPLWDAFAWKSAIRATDRARQKRPGQIIRLRYEDLVQEPEREVQRICTFLHLPFLPTMLDVAWTNSTVESTSSRRGISGASIGKWQKWLRPEEVALCQQIAQREMLDNDYTPMFFSPLTQLKGAMLVGRSGVEFFERLYRRWRLGGVSYLRNVLNKYWIRLVNVSKG